MIELTINWTNALIVTLLGFSLVFCLLVLLVFVLRLFGVIMAPKEKKEVPVKDSFLENTPQSMVSGGLSNEEQAVVGLALQMYYDADCKETGKLTLKAKPTAWNAKIYGINNLDK